MTKKEDQKAEEKFNAMEITTIKDLMAESVDNYKELKSGKTGLRESKGRDSSISKAMGILKLKLEYNAYMKVNAKVSFLEGDM